MSDMSAGESRSSKTTRKATVIARSRVEVGSHYNGFVVGLPRPSLGHEVTWVVIDPLNKSGHFLPCQMMMSIDKLAELYMQEIVRFHGVLASIISDRDLRSTFRF